MLIDSMTKAADGTQQASDFTLRDCVKQTVESYLKALGDQQPKDLYEFVITEMEIPLFEKVLEYTGGVELRAAKVLGIARGTLRTKLKKHNIEKNDFKDKS